MRIKKWLVFLMCLAPVSWIVIQAILGRMSPDPGKELVLFTGIWTLRFLILTLALTPIKRITGITEVIRYRRMIGLYVLFYASLHLVTILTYLLGWSWSVFIEEFKERPYMAFGIMGWLLLIPLGLTSNRIMMKKVGRHWKTIHKLVYLIAILGCAHFLWLIRSDYWQAYVYSLMVLVLLLYRFIPFVKFSVFKSL